MDQNPETQPIESLTFNEWLIKFFPVFAQKRAQALEGVGNLSLTSTTQAPEHKGSRQPK
jgi:hypothetical protein